VTIRRSSFVRNAAFFQGGALFSGGGTVTITNSTLAGNTALIGGGLANFRGSMTLRSSTVAHNQSEGVQTDGGSVEILNTILANNIDDFGDPHDCLGVITSQGHNLLGTLSGCMITLLANDLVGNPRLGPFQDTNRPGRSHFPLLPDSPAIDAGDPGQCPLRDQLGQPRVGICDIGAVEFQPTAPEAKGSLSKEDHRMDN
jgi:hypothetical protein